MKIDENIINEAAVKTISGAMDGFYDLSDDDGSMDNMRLMVLGQINGVVELVEGLKKLLEE